MNTFSAVQQIENYITKFENDQCDSWEYEHTPYLEKKLDELIEEEVSEFNLKIWDWPEFHLYTIADPIIFCNNKYLDSSYLYSKIFSQINNMEYLDYLVENLAPSIHHGSLSTWSTDLIVSIKANVLKVIETKGQGWFKLINETLELLDSELSIRLKGR